MLPLRLGSSRRRCVDDRPSLCSRSIARPHMPAGVPADTTGMPGHDHTVCTAVASDAVFTVRTEGTRPLYGLGLVRKSASPETSSRRSRRYTIGQTRNLAQVRVALSAAIRPGDRKSSRSAAPSPTLTSSAWRGAGGRGAGTGAREASSPPANRCGGAARAADVLRPAGLADRLFPRGAPPHARGPLVPGDRCG